jgi:hypothetical protein
MSVHTLDPLGPTSLVIDDQIVRPDPDAVTAEPLDPPQQLSPARGIAHGLLLSVPFWLLLGASLWLWL